MNSELDWAHRLNCPICKNSVYVNMQLYENDPYLGDQEVEKEVSKELNEPYIKILEKMKKELKK